MMNIGVVAIAVVCGLATKCSSTTLTTTNQQIVRLVYDADLQLRSYDASEPSVGVRVGGSEFQCSLESAASKSEAVPSDPHPQTYNASESQTYSASEYRRFKWKDQQLYHSLKASKISYLENKCYLYMRGQSSWTYEVCIGRDIAQYYKNRGVGERMGRLYSLGRFQPELEVLFPNGTMQQEYYYGTDGRRTTIHFQCKDAFPSIASIRETGHNVYQVIFTSPSFCDWREGANSQPPVDALVRGLEGVCFNHTSSSDWSYEYCHPDSAIQFSTPTTDGKINEMFLIGTMHRSNLSLPSLGLDITGAIQALRLRSPTVEPPLPSDKPMWRNLPIELAHQPARYKMAYPMSQRIDSRPKRVLLMRMLKGSMCGDTGMVRKTRVFFECPDNLDTFVEGILRVLESSMCQYDIYISTALVCAHPSLKPLAKQSPSVVKCNLIEDSSAITRSTPPVVTDSLKSPRVEVVKLSDKPHMSDDEGSTPSSLRGFLPYQSIGSTDILGDVSSQRYREGPRIPRYRIGQVVRHKASQLVGVVLGWDTSEWRHPFFYDMSRTVEDRACQEPHYLFLTNSQGVLLDARLSRLGYFRESDLFEATMAADSAAVKTFLNSFFSDYDSAARRFTVADGSPLAKAYPHDWPKR